MIISVANESEFPVSTVRDAPGSGPRLARDLDSEVGVSDSCVKEVDKCSMVDNVSMGTPQIVLRSGGWRGDEWIGVRSAGLTIKPQFRSQYDD